MDNSTGVKYSLPPFDVVVCSSWLAVRKCQCPAHIAQSDAVPAAVNNHQVPMDFVDQPVITNRCQQQDMKLPMVNEPAFELRIRCQQVVEHFNSNATPSNLSPSSRPNKLHIPCRAEDGRVYVEHNHFINGIKVTLSVIQGQPFKSTLDVVKRIRWFCNTMRDNRRIVFSLLGIYRNASSPEMKVSMTQSIQRLRGQYPTIPQGSTHLLLETALEAMAYKTVMKGTTKSRTTTRTGRGRDSISTIPIANDTKHIEPDAKMREPIATNTTDNNNNNNHDNNDSNAREPWSTKQKQQPLEDGGKWTNEKLQQQEEANNNNDEDDDHDVEDYFPSPQLPPFVPGEPSPEYAHLLFISSCSFDNNNNNNTKNNTNNKQRAALVPDCNTSPNFGDEIGKHADLALNYHHQDQQQQQQQAQQQRRQRQECLELDLEMDEWRRSEQVEQESEVDQSNFSDFNDFSEEEEEEEEEEEQNKLFEEDDESALVDEDEDLEMWGEDEDGDEGGVEAIMVEEK
ncbi:hypothetical protein K457DRAFT_129065 [Linnemannia elongata AG-77]|uniref:Uncharacterized protein n=1 Tax=Linnemannia elongata AG-77 TaxID=1314771 RepID=A0A197JJI9_9FUNG|nr:hypothetical protein K457DRAFT_129065 [Linnemannia elongata AG-77]